MSEDTLRGSVIIGYLNFVKKTWGVQGLNECIQATGADPAKVKEGGWYDFKSSNNILKWINDVKGPEYVVMAGNYLIKNLGMLAYVLRFVNIKTILKRAPEGYSDAFRYGRIRIDIKEKSAKAVMTDVAVDEFACPAWTGALRGMLELTKTKGTVKKTQCQRDGATHCEYEIEWE